MRLARLAAKVLLTLIVLCETGVAWRLWRHGPPMEMVITSDRVKEAGELSFKMVRVQPSASDWTILVAVIALQVTLVVFLWRSRRKIAESLPAKG
jgi:hypothetical protein